jgi:hypothetical protein
MISYNNYKLPQFLEYVGDGFTIRKSALCIGQEALNFMQKLCEHLIAHPDPLVVPIYNFEYIGAYSGNTHKYSYDMARLGGITREETNIIWQVGDAWRAGIEDPTRHYKQNADCWDGHEKMMHFLEKVVVLNRYHDLHGENVMMDNDGDYRLIDLEGFKNPPLSRPSNFWITGVR